MITELCAAPALPAGSVGGAKLCIDRTELIEPDVACCLSGGGVDEPSPPGVSEGEGEPGLGPVSVEREIVGGRQKEAGRTRAGGL